MCADFGIGKGEGINVAFSDPEGLFGIKGLIGGTDLSFVGANVTGLILSGIVDEPVVQDSGC